MSGDMFRGSGWALLTIACVLIAIGALGGRGCSYICNKYEVKVQERK